MTDDRERWNEKYSDADFDLPDDPMPALERRIETLPDGRALDIATGTGRNALFLAEHGYAVDAIDVSDAALERARERAADRGVDANVNWIRADLDEYDLAGDLESDGEGEGESEDETGDGYDVITISFFAALEHLPAIKEALAPGGVLVYEHHLRSSEPVDVGPSSDRYRYRSNDLLQACLDLTILSYEEQRRSVGEYDGVAAVATLVARNSSGGAQSYPLLEEQDADDIA